MQLTKEVIVFSLKRSENISRSPLFEQISASMEGLHIIHSFDQTEHFIDILKVNLDSNRFYYFSGFFLLLNIGFLLNRCRILVVLRTLSVHLFNGSHVCSDFQLDVGVYLCIFG